MRPVGDVKLKDQLREAAVSRAGHLCGYPIDSR